MTSKFLDSTDYTGKGNMKALPTKEIRLDAKPLFRGTCEKATDKDLRNASGMASAFESIEHLINEISYENASNE